MSRSKSKNSFQETLGFFIQGIPVVFVGSEIALFEDPALLRYGEFAAAGGEWPDGLEASALLEGLGLNLTFAHEVRHFHDALLSPWLFELFVLRHRINMAVFGLALELGEMSPEQPLRLPLNIPLLRRKSPVALSYVKEILRLERLHRNLVARVSRPVNVTNVGRITLKHLLETSATLIEFVSVMIDHGAKAAADYYFDVIDHLEPEYSLLPRLCLRRPENIYEELGSLYLLLCRSLWSPTTPVETFAALWRKKQDGTLTISVSEIQSLFDNEERLKERIFRIVRKSILGEPETVKPPGILGQAVEFHREIYSAREQVIRKYVREHGCELRWYLEHLDELPLPAVVFYPSERRVRAGRIPMLAEERLHTRAEQAYVIRAQQDAEGKGWVLAGMRNVPGGRVAHGFDSLNIQLAMRYFSKAMFERGRVLYSPYVDDVYAKVFREVVFKTRN